MTPHTSDTSIEQMAGTASLSTGTDALRVQVDARAVQKARVFQVLCSCLTGLTVR